MKHTISILCVLMLSCTKSDQPQPQNSPCGNSPGLHYCPDGHCYSYACPQPYQPPHLRPWVVTNIVYGVDTQSAMCYSNYGCGDEVGCSATERGVCWSTGLTLTILDRKSSDGPGSEGGFVSKICGLSADSTYHATAYAKNSYGVVYGNSVTFRTFNAAPVTDLSGNVYHPLIIGTQVWMNENLKTTKYKDGTDISGYSWYNNDENQYKNPYGALYSWETISSDKLCPVGWHVPSSDEFDKLIAYGDPLHQNKDIDKTEFSSVFGGLWSDPGGFSSLDHYGFYGSSSETFFVRTLTRTVVNISMR